MLNAKWNPDDFEKDNETSFDEDDSGNRTEKSGIDWNFGFNHSSDSNKTDDSDKTEKTTSGSDNEDSTNKTFKNYRKMPKGKWFMVGLLIAILVFLVFSGLYTVPEGKIAYVTQFGKIVSQTSEPGLKFHIPFVQSAHYLTNKMMVYDVNQSEVLTADKKAMVVDSYALWKIDDVTKFMRTVGGNVNEMERRIDASVYSNIKNIMGGLMQSEIISDEESSRDNLNDRVTKSAGEELDNYGVKVLRVEIRRFDLPKDNLSAVYKRMISERNQMAAAIKADGEYEAAKMRNETDKEYRILIGEAEASARRLQGEGEAEYMAVMEKLYGDKDQAEFYKFMLEIDALEASLGGEKTIILGPDSVLGSMFREADASAPEDGE